MLGFFWYLCLLAFLRWGRSTLLYVGAFVVVSYLEILGTAWGVWTWMPVDTIMGWVPMGNPPSIAAGGYGWFDLYAVLLAPASSAGGTVAAACAPTYRAPASDQDSAASTASWSSPLVRDAAAAGPGRRRRRRR